MDFTVEIVDREIDRVIFLHWTYSDIVMFSVRL